MSIATDIAAFVARLDSAIDSTMQGPVLDGAKRAIWLSSLQRVYAPYTPEFYSRRMSGGGIASEDNKKHDYGDKTLTIRDETPWQQLWEGSTPGEKLVDALASGSSRYDFQNAGPRTFMTEAEKDFAPEFESLLASGLRAAGFVVH